MNIKNWAISGLGNNAIMQRVNEALTQNKITAQDYVVVQFTDFNRLDLHISWYTVLLEIGEQVVTFG